MTLLLGYSGPRYLLLTLAGERPLLLTCPPELRVVAPDPDDDEPEIARASTMPPPLPIVRTRLRVDPSRVWQDVAPPPSERPRPPEQHIDPRTVFKRKPSETVLPRTRSTEPVMLTAASSATHDHLIIPTNPNFRVAELGIKAVITYLRNSQILVAKKERVVGDATIIEFVPDVFAHMAFTEGTAPSGAPSILEGTLWISSKLLALPFADPTRTSCLRLEIIGARFPKVSEAFSARLHQILYLRPIVLTAPHDPTRLRGTGLRFAADPIPRCDVQET